MKLSLCRQRCSQYLQCLKCRALYLQCLSCLQCLQCRAWYLAVFLQGALMLYLIVYYHAYTSVMSRPALTPGNLTTAHAPAPTAPGVGTPDMGVDQLGKGSRTPDQEVLPSPRVGAQTPDLDVEMPRVGAQTPDLDVEMPVVGGRTPDKEAPPPGVRELCRGPLAALLAAVRRRAAVQGPRVPLQEHRLGESLRCRDYNESAAIQHVAYTNVYDSDVTSADDVTLVTQATLDRMGSVLQLVADWAGPVSVTLYLDVEEAALRKKQTLLHRLLCQPVMLDRANVRLHLVAAQGRYYPINHLRNIALDEVRSDYLFLVDADFLLPSDLYPRLLYHVRAGSVTQDKALVVPAFEFRSPLANIPQTKAELLAMWQDDTLLPFHKQTYWKGHKPTKYDTWRQTNQSYSVEWADEYEPYLVLARATCPAFSPQFVGRGYNKAQHAAHLHVLGFQFVVLPDVYIIHAAHASSTISAYMGGRCATRRYVAFKEEMERRYNVSLPHTVFGPKRTSL